MKHLDVDDATLERAFRKPPESSIAVFIKKKVFNHLWILTRFARVGLNTRSHRGRNRGGLGQ